MLLEQTTKDLMTQFGAGQPTPGSGSAAALQGVLATRMLLTTCLLTSKKVKDPQRVLKAKYVEGILRTGHVGHLEDLVQRDADTFSLVIDYRNGSKRTLDAREKRRLTKLARRQLEKATEVALEIARQCIDVAKLGLQTFEFCYRAARGDPSAGISAAIAGVVTALSVIYQNLSTSRGGKRAVLMIEHCHNLWNELQSIQAHFMKIVSGLRDDVVEAIEGQSNFYDLGLMGPPPKSIQPTVARTKIRKMHRSNSKSVGNR